MNRVKRQIKKNLYRTLYYSGIGEAILNLVAATRKDHGCIILLYHQIVDGSHPYLDKGPVVHHPLEDFRQEIRFLKKNFQILSMDEVVAHISEHRPFRKPSIAITFDDGYLDNYTLAWPVLREYEVPATIYLTTGLIATHERTWTDQIELALLETVRKEVVLPDLFGEVAMSISTIEDKQYVNQKLAEALKLITDRERKQHLSRLFSYLKVNIEVAQQKRRAMLNWDEVREMASSKITFGSHSHSHPILSRLPFEQSKHEIHHSKSILEESLQQSIAHFAYPNGRAEDFSEHLQSYCAEIGFSSIATVLFGKNYAETNPYLLRRIGAVGPVWNLAGTIMREVGLF